MSTLAAVMRLLLGCLFRAYRLVLSPLLGPACRFEPSCSRYAEEAIARHGLLQGGRLAVHRICRCHPFAVAGFDPVPAAAAPRVGARSTRTAAATFGDSAISATKSAMKSATMSASSER
jgi:putative membrane protein insertion efficiency factor